MEYYSHIAGDRKELVEDHLELTAKYASKYASEIGFPCLGRLIGYGHDVCKKTMRFQKVLQHLAQKINHAFPSAAAVVTALDDLIPGKYTRQVIFGIIKGHHGEITGPFDEALDDETEESIEAAGTDFEWIEEDDGKVNAISSRKEYEDAVQLLRNKGFGQAESLEYLRKEPQEDKMLAIRMLSSCLVDGDYTATYLFDKDETEYVSPASRTWDELLGSLKQYRGDLIGMSDKTLPINGLRERVYQCAAKAGASAGNAVYLMTAPTGTAKTLAMLRFALGCAKRNHQRRVFVVLPYLSIIHQVMDTYNKIFGDGFVLEDDSTSYYKYEASGKSGKAPSEAAFLRIVSDKWDSQIIVTSNVKFYETLFSAKPHVLRKLHNVSNSVVLFDEFQTLPSAMMDLSVNTLAALTKYNVTVLLSTATQPEIGMRKGVRVAPTEIIDDVDGLYAEYEKIHKTNAVFMKKKVSYDDLAEMMQGSNQSLFVFNTIGKAWKMYDCLHKRSGSDVFILYTYMCSEHRKKVIDEVMARLRDGRPCILVSTQCIEAGVDVDFPLVFREYAPYSSVVQAAGRCNRSGTGEGRFFVFQLDGADGFIYPDNRYRTETAITLRLAEKRNHTINLSDRTVLMEYYRYLFSGDGSENKDKKELSVAVAATDFVETDRHYKIIDNKNQATIIVPYDDGKNTYNSIVSELETNGFAISKKLMARSHPVTVSVYAPSKTAQKVLNNCQPLFIRRFGICYETNWYLMLKKEGSEDGYNESYGLETKGMEGSVMG